MHHSVLLLYHLYLPNVIVLMDFFYRHSLNSKVKRCERILIGALELVLADIFSNTSVKNYYPASIIVVRINYFVLFFQLMCVEDEATTHHHDGSCRWGCYIPLPWFMITLCENQLFDFCSFLSDIHFLSENEVRWSFRSFHNTQVRGGHALMEPS